MGGTNPYITTPSAKTQKKYRITFANENKTIEVDPSKIPFGETGLPGSILDIALNHGIAIDHACGGVCACATCHVYVKKGLPSCSKAIDSEEDMLDMAPDLKPESRLSCQCIPSGDEDIVVEIPSWNRNLIKEEPT